MVEDKLECSNCNAVIGRKEVAHLHNDKPVCGACYYEILERADRKRPATTVVRGGEIVGVEDPRPATPAPPATPLGRPATIRDGVRIGIGLCIVWAILGAIALAIVLLFSPEHGGVGLLLLIGVIVVVRCIASWISNDE